MERILQIPLERLSPSPQLQKRGRAAGFAHQKALVEQFGFLHPILAKQTRPFPHEAYEILDGYENWLIAGELGFDKVPVLPLNLSDAEITVFLAQKADSKASECPIHKAQRFQAQLEENPSLRKTNLAYLENLPLEELSHLLRLLKLSPQVQRWIQQKKITAGQGRRMVCLSSAQQESLAQDIIQNRLTNREIEERVRSCRRKEKKVGRCDKRDKLDVVSQTENTMDEATRIATRDLERKLSEQIGCPVTLENGKLVIDYFGDNEVLDNVLVHLQ